MAQGIYVGVNTPTPVYETTIGDVTINSSNMEDYFDVTTSGTYGFMWNGSDFISNNKGKDGTTAKTILTAKVDMNISFAFGVSSESNYDEFTIIFNEGYIDAADEISGTKSGSYKDTLKTGQTIELIYSKDGSSASGSDAAWIKNIVLSNVEIKTITGYEYKDVARKVKKAYVGIQQFEKRPLPSGYTQVEYIESSGTQYIDTGIKPNQDTRIITTISDWSTLEESTTLWGTQSGSADRYEMFIASGGVYRSYYGGNAVSFDSSVSYNEKVTIDRNGNTITIGEYSKTNTVTTFSCTTSLHLFTHSSGGTATSNKRASLKLYSCQIYDSGTLARDYVPCTNSTGVGGLYDLVNSKFYGNAGTGTFTVGDSADSVARHIKKAYIGIGGGAEYREVEYIESSGTQYIDTGVGSNYKLIMDIQFINTGTRGLMGQSTNGGYYFGVSASGYYDVGTTSSISALTRRQITVEGTSSTLSLTAENQTITATRSVTVTNNLSLFGGSFNSGLDGYPCYAKLYSCQIYDNDVLVRDYVPAINSNGTAGLFDKVNKQFVFNAGTGNFANGGETGEIHISSAVARPCFSGGGEVAYYGTITPLSQARYSLVATTVGNYALFGGGDRSSSITARVDAYDTSLTSSSPQELTAARYNYSATTVGNYAIFGGGYGGSSAVAHVETYNTSLTRVAATGLSQKRYKLAATTVGDYALFGGGYADSGNASSDVDGYDTSLTKKNPTLYHTRYNLAATTVGDYALFGGGNKGSGLRANVEAFDKSLTRSDAASLSVARQALVATTVGNYAIFAGGGDNIGYCSTVDAYDTSLTRTTATSLSAARNQLTATSIGSYALFGGGNNGAYCATVDVYDVSLTRTTTTNLKVERDKLAATTVGNYALFGGGYGNVNSSFNNVSTVDVYVVV